MPPFWDFFTSKRTIAAAPQPAAPPQRRYGITEANELMRGLASDENPELIIRVIRKTLESVGVHVTELIADAKRHEAQVAAEMQKRRATVAELEQRIEAERRAIVGLEGDVALTIRTRERLERAEASRTQMRSSFKLPAGEKVESAGAEVPKNEPLAASEQAKTEQAEPSAATAHGNPVVPPLPPSLSVPPVPPVPADAAPSPASPIDEAGLHAAGARPSARPTAVSVHNPGGSRVSVVGDADVESIPPAAPGGSESTAPRA